MRTGTIGGGTITPRELDEPRRGGKRIDLIDVRTTAEHGEVRAEGARNVPLDRLDARALIDARDGSGDEPLYLIRRSGNRVKQACERVAAAGFANAVNVEGGTLAWEQAGPPVVRGRKKVVSLERQVRIAAGSLVLLGTTLGAFAHPYFLGLSAFVGAGLVFAGVTDTRGMAMMLGRSPWNRVGREGASCSS